MLNLGRILISDLLVANLFMHSLSGMILFCFYAKGVFERDILLKSNSLCSIVT